MREWVIPIGVVVVLGACFVAAFVFVKVYL